MIIIPDVHGRKFWKDAMGLECPKVFLGDYLDPYDDEGVEIGGQEALDNFREIIDYASADKDVKLLVGNHDLEYMIGKEICYCRCDDYRYNEIRDLFHANIDLFDLCYETEIGGGRFFLSHAGLNYKWYARHKELFGVESYEKAFDAELLNELFRRGYLDDALGDYSYFRGWFGGDCGSIVWADIREFALDDTVFPKGIKQIVGHTRCKQTVDLGGIVCIDSEPHSCYRLGDDGVLEKFMVSEKFNLLKS